jgi:F0F1-type ATP synthase membrane subunit b/b'
LDDNHPRVLDDNVYLSQLFQNDNLSPDRVMLSSQAYVGMLEGRCSRLAKRCDDARKEAQMSRHLCGKANSECADLKKECNAIKKNCEEFEKNREKFEEKYEKYKKKYKEKVKDCVDMETAMDLMNGDFDSLFKAAGYDGVDDGNVENVVEIVKNDIFALHEIDDSMYGTMLCAEGANAPSWVNVPGNVNEGRAVDRAATVLLELSHLRDVLGLFGRDGDAVVAVGKLMDDSAKSPKLQIDYDDLMREYNEIENRNVALMHQSSSSITAVKDEELYCNRLTKECDLLYIGNAAVSDEINVLEAEAAALRVKLEAFESVKK